MSTMSGDTPRPTRTPRVVHVTSVHPATDTRILYKECHTLSQSGYDVHLVAPGTESPGEVIAGIPVLRVNTGRSRLFRIFVGTFRAIRAAVSLKPDAIHLHDPELLLFAWWAKAHRIVVFFDMHEDLPRALTHKTWIPGPLRKPAGRIASLFETRSLRQMPVVLAEDSYLERRPWLKQFAIVRNMPVLGHFADLPTGRVTPARLAYIGHLSVQRGCFTNLDVVAELQRRGLSVQYDCVGVVPNALAAESDRLASQCADDSVHMHGYLPAQQGYLAISGSSIGLALLHPEPNYIDSYPTKIFEYMAMGIPVVASDFPLYRSVLEKTGAGLPADPLDVSAVSDAIQSLLSDQERWSECARRGRKAVREEFNWEIEAQRLTAFYTTHLRP